jgi:DNA-binding MarR family transcriptional regulator
MAADATVVRTSDETMLDHLERSLAAVLRLLADRATASDLAERCGYDLPPASWALLEHLDTHGALRVSDIAACHGVDVSSITPRLKRLEQAGLVMRRRVPSDARASLISATAKGAEALESVHAARRDILRVALAGIDAGQVAGASDVLCRIAAQLVRDPSATAIR